MVTNTPNPASPPTLRSSRKNWVVLAVALALGGLAAYAASNYLSERMAEIDARANEIDTLQIVVAKHPRGVQEGFQTIAAPRGHQPLEKRIVRGRGAHLS